MLQCRWRVDRPGQLNHKAPKCHLQRQVKDRVKWSKYFEKQFFGGDQHGPLDTGLTYTSHRTSSMLSAKVRICTKPKKEENILLFHGSACSKRQGKKLLALRRHQVTTNQLPSDLHAPQDLERTPTVLPQSCTESQDVFTWTLERPNFSKLSNHFKFILL